MLAQRRVQIRTWKEHWSGVTGVTGVTGVKDLLIADFRFSDCFKPDEGSWVQCPTPSSAPPLTQGFFSNESCRFENPSARCVEVNENFDRIYSHLLIADCSSLFFSFTTTIMHRNHLIIQ